MGNALNFKQIFDEIQQDYNNQYYTDIAYQYGRMVRKIFDFQPIQGSSLASFFSQLDDKYTMTEDKTEATKHYPPALALSYFKSYL